MNTDRLRRYLVANHAKQIKLGDLAEKFRRSPSSIQGALARHCGGSFTQLLKAIRMRRVRELLRRSKLNLEQIAGRTGFRTRGGLQRCFKAYHGMTPGEYRLQCWGQTQFIRPAKFGRKRSKKGLHPRRGKGPFKGRWPPGSKPSAVKKHTPSEPSTM